MSATNCSWIVRAMNGKVIEVRECSICGEMLTEECFVGDICEACADRYDECGVYLCLG